MPEFFALIEAASLRVVDFVAGFAAPRDLPAVAEKWAELEARRTTAWKFPWSHAVLRALELADYCALKTHEPGWISARIGIDSAEETRSIEALRSAGLIKWNGSHYTAVEVTVDTRGNPSAARQALKAHWLRVAKARVERDAPGLYSFNVVGVSTEDLEQLREMHVRYFNAVRSVVASSSPAECVAVVSLQLYELGADADVP